MPLLGLSVHQQQYLQWLNTPKCHYEAQLQHSTNLLLNKASKVSKLPKLTRYLPDYIYLAKIEKSKMSISSIKFISKTVECRDIKQHV